jgi:hypothetical protein
MNLFDYHDSSTVDTLVNPSDITTKSYTDIDLQLLDGLFINNIGFNIQHLLQLQAQYSSIGSKIVADNSMEIFFNKLFTASCPKVLKYSATIQQLYQLHIFSILLCRYNDQELHFDNDEFIQNVYMPNIMGACAKHLISARRFIQRLVRISYNELYSKCRDIVDIYYDRYRTDSDSFKNEVIYLFLRNILLQFDPLEIKDPDKFYSTIMYRIFFFFLKSKTTGLINNNIDRSIIQLNIPSERYRIYEEALYLSQIRNMCNKSEAMDQISKKYETMKQIIIPNEIQKLFLMSLNKGHVITPKNKIALMKTFDQFDNIAHLRSKAPSIYRLLRSIHILSDKSSLIVSDIDLIHNRVYSTLYAKFDGVLNKDIIKPVLTNITDNLVSSLTIGEYIDMLTLTTVKITGNKFIEQLEIYLNIVLSEVGV